VTALCLVFFRAPVFGHRVSGSGFEHRVSGTGTAQPQRTMRDYDEEDPKKPQPVRRAAKGTNEPESAEAFPWRLTRKDDDRDRHRHVC
jgi:hypothetical protein